MNTRERHRGRLTRFLLVVTFLLTLVPALPGAWTSSHLPGFLSSGDASAEECVTTCKSYDQLMKSWSNVTARQAAIDAAASATGVPANLIKAVMKLESNGLNLLPNGATAVGPMQVTTSNWGWWAQTNGLNLYNADDNIMAGAKILDRFRIQYLEWSQENGVDPWLTALYSYYAGHPRNLLLRDSPAQGGSGITTGEYGARIWNSYQWLQENWPALSQAKVQTNTIPHANAGANPARATDGSLSTNWAVIGKDAPPPGAYLQIDLGEPTRVFEISWVFGRTGFADRLRIRISDDGTNYETIHVAGNAPAKSWQRILIDRPARFVRFNVDNLSGNMAIGYIAEVEVRGVKASEYVAPPLPLVNLELPGSGGSAGASYTGRVRDGRLDTDWRTTGAPNPASGYVYIDLGSEVSISEVAWVFSQSGGAPKLEIQISNNKQTWTTIGTAGNATAGNWQHLETSVTARYVRWLITNTTNAPQIGFIAEVAIKQMAGASAPLEEPDPEPESAPTAPVHAMPGSGGSAGATFTGRVRDGRLDTDWHTSGAPYPGSGYFYIDLGSEQAIGLIEWVFNQTGGAPSLEIQTSNDKRAWATIGSAGDAPAGAWQQLATNVTARYIRWLITNTTGVEQIGYIAEVRVTGMLPVVEPTPTPTTEPEPSPIPSVPESIDISQLPGGSALAISSISDSGGGVPAAAIDSVPGTSWHIAGTEGWLQINLGAEHQISHIGWLASDASCASGLTVMVSVDGENWTTSLGFPTATAWAWQVTATDVAGRYVRWSLAGTSVQVGCLAEVAIWGSAIAPESTEELAGDEIELPREPTPEPTVFPIEPTIEPEPTATVAPDEPTAEPTLEATVEPTAPPVVETTPEPTSELSEPAQEEPPD